VVELGQQPRFSGAQDDIFLRQHVVFRPRLGLVEPPTLTLSPS
jgi:hypothetical protein